MIATGHSTALDPAAEIGLTVSRQREQEQPLPAQGDGKRLAVRRFEHRAAGVDWYCEQRGDGAPIVLVPSGEGDCASFEQLAAHLADEFTVLTFDIPGFSRSHVRTVNDISVSKLAQQIAGLVESLGTYPATFYGCSSGGIAVLDLVVDHPDLVRNAVVHEVAMAGAAAPLVDLTLLDDAAVVESCRFAFGHMMNDDLAAWDALGDEYHARLANNYVTWVRHYLSGELPPPHPPKDLAGKPITWTIGALTPAGLFFDNVVLAVESGCNISPLNCKHFPQVSAPAILAEHIRATVPRAGALEDPPGHRGLGGAASAATS